MWWKNTRLLVMIIFVVIFLVWLLVGLGCGLPGITFPCQTNLRMVEMQIIGSNDIIYLKLTCKVYLT
jgi:hypothetical protein